jgi:hypothetical protein
MLDCAAAHRKTLTGLERVIIGGAAVRPMLIERLRAHGIEARQAWAYRDKLGRTGRLLQSGLVGAGKCEERLRPLPQIEYKIHSIDLHFAARACAIRSTSYASIDFQHPHGSVKMSRW